MSPITKSSKTSSPSCTTSQSHGAGCTTGTDSYVAFECADWRLKVAIEKLFGGRPDSEPSYASLHSLLPGGGGVMTVEKDERDLSTYVAIDFAPD